MLHVTLRIAFTKALFDYLCRKAEKLKQKKKCATCKERRILR